jgi:hypothetical protein
MKMQLCFGQPAQPIYNVYLRIAFCQSSSHLSILGFRRVKLTSLAAVEEVDDESND